MQELGVLVRAPRGVALITLIVLALAVSLLSREFNPASAYALDQGRRAFMPDSTPKYYLSYV